MALYQDSIPFSDVDLKTTFSYIENKAVKTNRTSSVTFYYNGWFATKVSLSINENIDDSFRKFKDILNGTSIDSLFLEMYPQKEDEYTYLIYDERYYKIGKTNNLEKRLSSLKTANPYCEIIASSKYTPEKLLHDLFSKHRVDREWFSLEFTQVETLVKLMSVKDKRIVHSILRMAKSKIVKRKRDVKKDKEIDKMLLPPKAKLWFGKYRGVDIYTMKTPEHINYLKWLHGTMSGKRNKKCEDFLPHINRHLNYLLKRK